MRFERQQDENIFFKAFRCSFWFTFPRVSKRKYVEKLLEKLKKLKLKKL